MDIATISHKSKLTLSKINRAVRLETLGETLIGEALFQRNIQKLCQFMSFFHIIADLYRYSLINMRQLQILLN